MARARNTITQRIALTGGKEIEAELKQLGAVGEQAFRKLQASADRLRGPGLAFEQSIQRVERTLKNVGNGLIGLGTRLQTVGRNMSLYVSGPIAAIGAASVRSFAQFEKSMSDVSTLIDTSTESLEDMGKEVLEIGRRTPVRLEELTGALYSIRSAGIEAGDAMRVLEGSAQLGVAGLGTVAEAADIATSAINSFKIEGEAQKDVFNQLFLTVKSGKTTISELSQGFGAVAGIVSNAGVQLDEYLASVAALTTTGLPAAQAHRQIRAAVVALSKPTVEQIKLFKILGVQTLPELIEREGGFVNALHAVRKALGGNDAALQKAAQSVEAYAAIIGLTGANNEAYIKTIDEMRTSTGSLSEAFLKQLGNLQSKFTIFANNMESAAITLGQDLAPSVGKVLDVLISLSQAFSEMDPAVRGVIELIGGMLAVIGPAILGLGLLAGAFGFALKSLVPLGRALKLIFGLSGAGSIASMFTGAARYASLFGFAIGAIIRRLGILGIAFSGLEVLYNAYVEYTNLGKTASLEHAAALEDLEAALQKAKEGAPGAAQAFADMANEQATAVGLAVAATQELIDKQQEYFNSFQGTPIGLAARAAGEFDAQRQEASRENTQELERERAVLEQIVDKIQQQIAEFNKVTEAVAETGSTAEEVVTQAEQIIRVFRGGAENTVQDFNVAAQGIAGAAGEVVNLAQQIDTAKKNAGDLAQNIRNLTAEEGLQEVGEIIAGSLEKAAEVVGTSNDEIKAQLEGTVAAIGEQIEAINAKLASIAAPTQINDGLDEARRKAIQTGDTFDEFGNKVEVSFEAVGNSLTSFFNGIVSTISSALDRLDAKISSTKRKASSAGEGFSSGGPVQGFATGGHVWGPGTATSDSIPARLSRGEYVIRASVVKKMGRAFFDAINGGSRAAVSRAFDIPGFAFGGPVLASGSVGGSGGPDISSVLYLQIGGENLPTYASQDVADRIIRSSKIKAARRIGNSQDWR